MFYAYNCSPPHRPAMFENMRRLHPRSPMNRGIAVDGDGAVLGPACVLVRRRANAHQPIAREVAGVVQGLLLRDHQDPDWLYRQCGRIARALDEGQLALAQIYGLHIPIGELDDRCLSELSRLTDFARSGFNPDEPRVPKGDPRGGEWTAGGEDEGSGSASNSATSDSAGGGAEGVGDDAGRSGTPLGPTPAELGAGDPDGGVDGGGADTTAAGDGGITAPEPSAGARDASPQTPSVAPAGPVSSGAPSIEYIIVEPQNPETAGGIPPAASTAMPPSGIPTPFDSADVDDQIEVPPAIPGTTSDPAEPTSSSAPESGGPRATSTPNSETAAPSLGPLGPSPQFPAEQPQTTRQVNTILRSAAIWLGRAATILGPLFSSDPRVRLVWMALDAIGWLAENSPKIVSYLDEPKSLRKLQDAVDDRGPGYEIHHIVEAQRWSGNPDSNWRRFPDRINSRANLVRIPYWKHVEISAWYSRPNPLFGDLSPREYLRGKSWEEQYEMGLQALRDGGVLR